MLAEVTDLSMVEATEGLNTLYLLFLTAWWKALLKRCEGDVVTQVIIKAKSVITMTPSQPHIPHLLSASLPSGDGGN